MCIRAAPFRIEGNGYDVGFDSLDEFKDRDHIPMHVRFLGKNIALIEAEPQRIDSRGLNSKVGPQKLNFPFAQHPLQGLDIRGILGSCILGREILIQVLCLETESRNIRRAVQFNEIAQCPAGFRFILAFLDTARRSIQEEVHFLCPPCLVFRVKIPVVEKCGEVFALQMLPQFPDN